jgi:hypothetical protein
MVHYPIHQQDPATKYPVTWKKATLPAMLCHIRATDLPILEKDDMINLFELRKWKWMMTPPCISYINKAGQI